jgi:Fe(3+) dicitrate transport protein
MLFDGANNLIFDTLIYNQDQNTRNFTIFGLGISHKKSKEIELYGNISQNYRSVTFADMSIINPAFVISPDLQDEKGYTSNFGIKGIYKQSMSYNINYFYLSYQQRIGFIQKLQPDGNVKSERGNIGDAKISGIESLLEFNLFDIATQQTKCNFFINAAFIKSQYISSDQNGIVGNNVEFIPKTNLKTGLNFKFKSLYSNIQFSYVSEQFTDATNAITSNLSGVNGVIPSYKVLDFSLVYKTKKYSIESGINNLLNNSYFTRRATGYPGPGIIPSPRRNYYLTLEINF